jgi:hypothetical protein
LGAAVRDPKLKAGAAVAAGSVKVVVAGLGAVNEEKENGEDAAGAAGAAAGRQVHSAHEGAHASQSREASLAHERPGTKAQRGHAFGKAKGRQQPRRHAAVPDVNKE